jgi:hypothetical protein
LEGLSLHTLLWIDALSLLGGITGTNPRMSELLDFMSTGNNWTIPCNYQLVILTRNVAKTSIVVLSLTPIDPHEDYRLMLFGCSVCNMIVLL